MNERRIEEYEGVRNVTDLNENTPDGSIGNASNMRGEGGIILCIRSSLFFFFCFLLSPNLLSPSGFLLCLFFLLVIMMDGRFGFGWMDRLNH